MREMVQCASSLPSGFDYAWTVLSYQEQTSSNQAPSCRTYTVFVFLCLAALYESWTVPLAVLLAVPTVVIVALVVLAA